MKTAVVNCAQLVTMAGAVGPRTGAAMCDLGIVADGAMLIEDGLILQVGTRAAIERRIAGEIEA